MWQLASNIADTSAYLTDDAPYIIHGLKDAGFDPWLCRVHLTGWSQSRVYDITLPEYYTWPKGKTSEARDIVLQGKSCIGVNAHTPSFVIKIVSDTLSFKHEAKVLHKVKPCFFFSSTRFLKSKKLKLKNLLSIPQTISTIKILKERSESLLNQPNGWWCNEPPRPKIGGVLFMKFGEDISKDMFDNTILHKIFNDCMYSLKRMHSAGYVHTDIRLPNIVKIDDMYEIVDFGEAVTYGSSVNVSDFSDHRKELIALTPSELFNRDVVQWSGIHDAEMLTRALFEIIPGEVVIDIVTSQRVTKRLRKC
jgi:hypothetical protein